jgi:hypothetical protein
VIDKEIVLLGQVGTAITTSISTVFSANIVICIVMMVSMKSMWQLTNVSQLISILPDIGVMPASALLVSGYVTDVIYMKFIPSSFFMPAL